MTESFDARLIAELTTPVDPRIYGLVKSVVGVVKPRAVLFYGSGLRSWDPDGLFDFYILLDRLSDWRASPLVHFANHLLPPNVFYAEHESDGETVRAKIAVMTLSQFRELSSPRACDVTIWARFCQPVRLVWVRDSSTADDVLAAVKMCVMTASGWAARLQSGSHTATVWWDGLFRRTYRAELRVEGGGRASTLVSADEKRYEALLPLAWCESGITFGHDRSGRLAPDLTTECRKRAERRWTRMARQGRWRNVARLVKAAFTFRDGASYLVWKIERHTGIHLTLSSFEARHPLICLPVLLWRARAIFLPGIRGRIRG